MILTKTVILLCLYCQVQSDCGQPGSSKSLAPDEEYLNAAQVYSEKHKVWYRCPTAIVGSYGRVCENGKWTTPIPKCRKYANISQFKHHKLWSIKY